MPRTRRCLPALLGLLAACAAAAPAGAVVGGTPVDPASVPWLADLGSCGGTLVAPDRVLTAAHCVNGRAPDTFSGITVGGAVRAVTHVALAPGWRHANGPSNYLDDVAVLELDQPVTGVPLVALGGIDVEEATILGRGRPFAPGTGHSEAQTLDATLRAAPLRTLSDAQCARAFKGHRPATGERFDPRMRCSIDADGAAPLFSGCNGDSGGPLWTGTAEAPVQLGIVSWGGDRCGADHLPSVFADVARYRAFITDPSPTWAPTKVGAAAKVSGTPRVGRRLRCGAPGYRPEPGAALRYTWKDVGYGRGGYSPPATIAHGATHRVAKAERGRRLACFAEAVNAGGYLTVGAATVLIKR